MDRNLLNKYFQNKCSPEEAREILKWIESSDVSLDLGDEFENAWKTINVKTGNLQKWEDNLKKVLERIEMDDLYRSLNLADKKKSAIRQLENRPAKTGAERTRISSNTVRKSMVPVIIFAAALILFMISWLKFPSSHEQKLEIAQIEKITEPGQKLSFHLSDGTSVILNSGSKIKYPDSFSEKERIVHIEGEAFFDVTKDVARPFTVITESVRTTALGTSFNVNSFPSKNFIEVALVSGKVIVTGVKDYEYGSSVILSPGEVVTVIKDKKSLVKSSFDYYQKISWKEGLIYFKDADYTEIANRLESWYGIEITQNKLPATPWKFTGKFENEILDNILISLQFGHEFDYDFDGKIVKIKF